jgi:hypothetical protein
MTGHGFGGVDHRLAGMIPQRSFDGIGFIQVPKRRGSAVSI